jgi:hypothetical protein
VTVVELHLFEMSWGRRFVLLLLGAIGVVVLGILLSAAMARPAGAATLPLPTPPSLPVPVTLPGGGSVTNTVSGVVGTGSSLPTDVVNEATAAASGSLPVVPTSPGSQLPIPLPVGTLPVPLPTLPTLPLPQLPVITRPGSNTLTSGVFPAGSTGGLAPGTGGPAHGRGVKLSGPTGHRTTAKSSGSGHSSTSGSKGTPTRTPGPRIPSPSFPLFNSVAGDSAVPGHGGSLWNALPYGLLLLALVAVGGVFLRRRISLTHLFDSRLSPPG